MISIYKYTLPHTNQLASLLLQKEHKRIHVIQSQYFINLMMWQPVLCILSRLIHTHSKLLMGSNYCIYTFTPHTKHTTSVSCNVKGGSMHSFTLGKTENSVCERHSRINAGIKFTEITGLHLGHLRGIDGYLLYV